ncbi:tRNA preQ1(34) S-adenosylmethionine ribosyltransferase-isomerase QueA [Pseudoramibacter porci]|uniref:S-adenosylmethionine:tRNA ribosyltransferase-isomerase n=1 Tax=Pseudoramibacter porci TaxID=2606631 RepID=A0A7X2NE99_9FIRM|nr:tRNA preQ1(34) S-adenosylmethionine ribosyltransferase-isomerase QueA [Pseudoramibacter porci]MSS19006.1 tRNA preQ1(34) S-adenosylmethionine ribosyltransferase-isomerase QueA [Pseudoramibacter porci]
MKKSDFYYDLPEALIAQTPAEKRDMSRLMVINRKTDQIEDRHFHDIVAYLKPGDLLVMNDTKVMPVRIYGHKKETGGKVELLLLKRLDDNRWETMVKPGRKAKPGAILEFTDQDGSVVLEGTIEKTIDNGLRVIAFQYDGVFEEILNQIGTMPLPPYIHEKLSDPSRYQTVYAKYNGSAAAPTAGLHFTEALLDQIRAMGVKTAAVTLHVGLGTFRPVKEDNILDHQMHSEQYSVSQETADLIEATKVNGGRVIAVGTTTVRTLESVAARHDGKVVAEHGATSIFIYPGFHWNVIDGLITNFHLPESTLLMLVASFYDREKILAAYRHAVKEKYRFFSFGDAMFIQ